MPDSGMKILIVDDFATMRRILKNILNQIGYANVDEAENGAQALEKVHAGGVELVITDWNMPVMDGFGLVKKIRTNEATEDLPILMVTAESEKEKVISAIQAGVNNYIVKPFTAEVLREKLNKIFGNQ